MGTAPLINCSPESLCSSDLAQSLPSTLCYTLPTPPSATSSFPSSSLPTSSSVHTFPLPLSHLLILFLILPLILTHEPSVAASHSHVVWTVSYCSSLSVQCCYLAPFLFSSYVLGIGTDISVFTSALVIQTATLLSQKCIQQLMGSVTFCT